MVILPKIDCTWEEQSKQIREKESMPGDKRKILLELFTEKEDLVYQYELTSISNSEVLFLIANTFLWDRNNQITWDELFCRLVFSLLENPV